MEDEQAVDTTKKKIKWLALEGNPEVSWFSMQVVCRFLTYYFCLTYKGLEQGRGTFSSQIQIHQKRTFLTDIMYRLFTIMVLTLDGASVIYMVW